MPTGEQETYYAQYFSNKDNSEILGSFFTPINIAGYSTEGQTLCFYPLGKRQGNFFARTGEYQFSITGVAANVKGQVQKRIDQVFRVKLTDDIYEQMQKEPDLEYPYSVPIGVADARRTFIDMLRGLGK